MKTLTIFTIILCSLLSISLNAQSNCTIEDLILEDVHSCTNSQYVYEFSFSSNQPDTAEYKVYYKQLPNGNSTFVGQKTYDDPTFRFPAKKNLSYSVYIFDANDPSCGYRDTIPPQECMAPCLVDSLSITGVECYPGSNFIEIRFDYPFYDFLGGFLYDVYDDTTKIANLWMAPWGKVFLDESYVGDTLRLCQVDDSLCCRTFIIPDCTFDVCPIYGVAETSIDTCINGSVQYEVSLEHAPPLQNYETELEVYDENGSFIEYIILPKNQTAFTLQVSESAVDRVFTICDAYQVCCYDLFIPASDCGGIVSSVNEDDLLSMTIYPNPASDQIQLKVDAPVSSLLNAKYLILNMMGQAVQSGTLDNAQNQINISSLTQGTYLFTIQNNEGQQYVERFVRM